MSEVLTFPNGKAAPIDTDGSNLSSQASDPHAQAFRDMEPEICDMCRASEILADLVGEAALEPDDQDKMGRALFMAELTVKFAAEMRSRYLRRYKGQPCD